MQTARLENWSYDGRQLFGDVYGHPDPFLPDGVFIHTSLVQEINADEGWAVTRNTRYTLGRAAGDREAIARSAED